jgi:hypothetical protein
MVETYWASTRRLQHGDWPLLRTVPRCSIALRRDNSDLATLRSLPFHYHVIKYDAARSMGHYDDGSWTSTSDIGDSLNVRS